MISAAPRALAAFVTLFFAVLIRPGTGQPDPVETQELVEKDLKIEFSVNSQRKAGILEGDNAKVTFRISDATTGKPVSSANPVAWIDMKSRSGETSQQNCKDKVSLYLRGMLGLRPVIDLNSYFILVLNRDPSISVIDPLVGITGRTSLYTTIFLSASGADWTKDKDRDRLYVTMPKADKVAVIDLETFKIVHHIMAGANPVRIALQPDKKYLWIGNNGREGAIGGVTAFDAITYRPAGYIPTGRGHHEIAFSSDSRFAYVTNREDATVTVIDVRAMKKLKEIKTGPVPISLAFSPLSQALYVADGIDGTVTVIDTHKHEIMARVNAKPGLGPQLVTPDGRWLLIVNSTDNSIHVMDTSSNRLVRAIPVGPQPYQMSLTREFVYVRCLGTERVSMITLPQIQRGEEPIVHNFAAGSKPPKDAGELSIAASISPTSEEHSVLVVNPNDGNLDYYMEGMNTAMGSFRNYGHVPMAVEIADRSLAESEPGVYSSEIKVPAAGEYDVAFLLRSPTIVHCFDMKSAADPESRKKLRPLEVEFLTKERVVQAKDSIPFRVRLTTPTTRSAKAGLEDVRIVYFMAPGKLRKEVPAREETDGVYEALLPIEEAGVYYFYVSAPSTGIRPEDLGFLSLQITKNGAAPAPGTRRLQPK